MKYNFETNIDRSDVGSFKYMEMQELYPDLPKDTVPFSMADMEFDNMPEVKTALKEYIDRYTLGYCLDTEAYRQSVCDFQKRHHNWDVNPDWIVAIPGALPGLFGAIQEFSEPGDGVIFFSPVFGWFKGGTELNGRTPVPCSLNVENGAFDINFDEFEKLAKDPKNKIVLFCNPHNPTSHVWSREDLERVAEICYQNDCLLVSDEVHADLVMPGFEQISMGSLDEKYHDNMIVIVAPSKTFNQAGMQAANLIIFREDWKKRMINRLRANGLFNITALGYKALEVAYNEGDAWLEQCIAQVWENHQALKAYMSENMPEVKVFDMQATYLQWMDFSALVKDSEELKDKLHEARVIMDQGIDFGPEGACYERMNLACPKDIMMDALERMKNVFYK